LQPLEKIYSVVERCPEQVEFVLELGDDDFLILDNSTKTGPLLLGDGLLNPVDGSISCFRELKDESLDALTRDRSLLHLGRVESKSLEGRKEGGTESVREEYAREGKGCRRKKTHGSSLHELILESRLILSDKTELESSERSFLGSIRSSLRRLP